MTVTMLLVWATSLLLLIGLACAAYFVLATRRIAAEAERLVPASGAFITVRGNHIHYVEQGEGPPILFIHGLGGQLHHFRHPLFKTFGSGYRLIALDRPGSGYSIRKGGKGSLTEQAEIIAALIDQLGLRKPLLVGHSLGGTVALAVALNHPDRISGIALLAPLTHREDTLRPQFRSLAIRSPIRRWLVAHTVAAPASLKYARQTLDFVFGPQPPPEEYRIEGGGLAGLRPSHIYATASDLVALEHELAAYEARFGEIRLPVGILFGSADRVLDYREHGLPMAGRIAGLDLEILEGIGHMPQFVAAERVVAFIRRVAERAFPPTGESAAGGTEQPIAAFEGKNDGERP